jgi:DNA-binding CsgD family transcriptional regulator/DNA-binding FrmR family transcriptional regulator
VQPIREEEPAKLERALHERIKELNCLYGLAQLMRETPESLGEILPRIAALLPPAWQYPEICCARIGFGEEVFRSEEFKVTRWRQTARIVLDGEPVGEVAVFYTEERPALYEGPFLREERILLEAVAEHIAGIAKRLNTERELYDLSEQLRAEREALREANVALRAVLSRIEEEKRDIQRRIQANVEKVLTPMLVTLAMQVPKPLRGYVDLLRDNLDDIASPFIGQLAQRHRSLTPTEMAICNLIRSGLTSKEIAQLRGSATATINRHRERIRRKLGLAGTKTNLVSYLQTTG